VPARFGEDGLVHLFPQIPAAGIHYTVDGSMPTVRSPVFRGSVSLPEGGLVRAAVRIDKEHLGKVTDTALELPKTNWRILAADGDRDEEHAKQRARALIDCNDNNPWQPDQGKDAQVLPLAVTVDLGAELSFCGIAFRGPNLPQRLRVGYGESLEAATASLKEFLLEDKRSRVVDFGGLVKARVLHICFDEMQPGHRLRIGEMDLHWPSPSAVKDDQKVTLVAPSGPIAFRYSKSSRPPHRDSQRLPPELELSKGERLLVRAFASDGDVVGPLRVFVRE
jgi:hypothetical protein